MIELLPDWIDGDCRATAIDPDKRSSIHGCRLDKRERSVSSHAEERIALTGVHRDMIQYGRRRSSDREPLEIERHCQHGACLRVDEVTCGHVTSEGRTFNQN